MTVASRLSLALLILPTIVQAGWWGQHKEGSSSCTQTSDCPRGTFCHLPDYQCAGVGQCELVPELCTADFSPVCGCDGQTYSNRCRAFSSAISIRSADECANLGISSKDKQQHDHHHHGRALSLEGFEETMILYKEREDTRRCGSRGMAVCEKEEFCEFQGGHCGMTDAPGVCTKTPFACNEIYSPVCGCDGNTYSNECVARSNQVSVKYAGSCEEEPEAIRRCGSRGMQMCEEGEYCDFQGGHCGMTDIPGVCTKTPYACNKMYLPVCGCDGMTYSNECMARSHQVSVRHELRCEENEEGQEQQLVDPPQSPQTSHSSASISTVEGGEAAGSVGEGVVIEGRAATAEGGVREEEKGGGEGPFAAIQRREKELEAKLLKVLSVGQPDVETRSCGGFVGAQCPDDEVCIFPQGTCGAADEMGKCMTAPFICTMIYQPVCGCDGQTYGNDCHAHSQTYGNDCHAHSKGVSIVYVGSCEGEGNDIAAAGEEMVDSSVHLRRGDHGPLGL